MNKKTILIILSIILCITLLASNTISALMIDQFNESAGTDSKQNTLDTVVTEEKIIFNVLENDLTISKNESLLETLKSAALLSKATVGNSKGISCDFESMPNVLSLDYSLYYYCASLDDKVCENPSVDFFTSSTKNDCLSINSENTASFEYLIFLSLLIDEYSDCMGYLDYKYYEYTYNRVFFPNLVFCPDYKEYGYATIYEYIDAARSGEEKRCENVYIINFGSKTIRKWGSDTNLYDTIFNNTVSE